MPLSPQGSDEMGKSNMSAHVTRPETRVELIACSTNKTKAGAQSNANPIQIVFRTPSQDPGGLIPSF
jgi:hypothetical protein